MDACDAEKLRHRLDRVRELGRMRRNGEERPPDLRKLPNAKRAAAFALKREEKWSKMSAADAEKAKARFETLQKYREKRKDKIAERKGSEEYKLWHSRYLKRYRDANKGKELKLGLGRKSKDWVRRVPQTQAGDLCTQAETGEQEQEANYVSD